MKKLIVCLCAVWTAGEFSAPAVTQISSAQEEFGSWSLGKKAGIYRSPPAIRPFIYRNMDEVGDYAIALVRHGDYLRPLPEGAQFDLDVEVNGRRENIASFMKRYKAAGLIVVKDGKVRLERYQYGNTRHSRWDMQSSTKSVLSTAVAAALHEKKIGSLDDQIVRYLPELKGSAYDGVTLQDALNLSSGVDQAPFTDAGYAAYESRDPGAMTAYLRSLPRKAQPGTRFAYNNFDTFTLGEVVRRTTGTTLADYISRKIWSPAGMEHDAYIGTTALGKEKGNGGLNATLRDMARFGLFALEGGAANGKQIVPPGWFERISRGVTDPKSPRFPGNIEMDKNAGYMNQWWLPPRGGSSYQLGDDGGFMALGAFAQQVYVVPGKRLVVVIHSADADTATPESPAAAAGRVLAAAIAVQLRD